MTIKGNKDVQDVYHAIESNDWVREPDQDPRFANTILFMSSVGNNGANNNVYLDSSTNNFTITRNGDTYQGSFSPHNPNGWSAFFDGTGDYLTIPDNTAIQVGSSDFTFEAWAYPLSLPSAGNYKTFWAKRTNSAGFGGACLVLDPSGNILFFVANSASSWGLSGSSTGHTVSTNTWQHLAMVRSGNTLILYKNGIAGTTVTLNFTVYDGTSSLSLMSGGSDGTQAVDGYMSNFRLVKGTALYTANFTPPTGPLAAISNTSLLTLQSNSLKDNSTNNFTITRNGDTKILPFSPFRMDILYNANTHGGSAYFDGTGDCLTLADSPLLELGSNNFTLEMWCYPTSSGSTAVLVGKWDDTQFALLYYIGSDNSISIAINNTNYLSSGANVITPNTWNHVAIVRSGSTWKHYVNGLNVSTHTLAAAVADDAILWNIGRNPDNAGVQYFTGYISNLRLVRGSAVYTGNFTPPSAPVTTAGDATIYSSTANVNTTFAAANTSLLCNFTNGGIIDLTGKNNIYTVGATQVSTSIFKDSKSFYFDGSGYYYFTDDIQYMYAKPITIEAWMYPTTSGTLRTFIEENTGGDNGEQYIALTSGNVFYFEQRNSHGYPVGGASTIGLATTATVNSNTWTHVAIVFSTTGVRMYVNGVLSASNAGVRYWNNAARKLNLGVQGYGFGNYIGYIEDFRITLGERYNANFTPLKLKRY